MRTPCVWYFPSPGQEVYAMLHCIKQKVRMVVDLKDWLSRDPEGRERC